MEDRMLTRTTAVDLVGQMAPLRVQLDRDIDRAKPCHDNIAIIRPGRGPHAAELRCESCGAHRGWLRAEALAFVESLTQRFGAPAEPLVLRNSTIGDHVMENNGVLFRNEDKSKETDRDYQGSITVAGVEYWLSAWIKQGRKGKFMSLAVKAKDSASVDKTSPKASIAAEFNDEIPF
jgi:hypothetical protein